MTVVLAIRLAGRFRLRWHGGMIQITLTVAKSPRGNHVITTEVSAIADLLSSERQISDAIRNSLEILVPLVAEDLGHKVEFAHLAQPGPDSGV